MNIQTGTDLLPLIIAFVLLSSLFTFNVPLEKWDVSYIVEVTSKYTLLDCLPSLWISFVVIISRLKESNSQLSDMRNRIS